MAFCEAHRVSENLYATRLVFQMKDKEFGGTISYLQGG